jgi:hypothetical protein
LVLAVIALVGDLDEDVAITLGQQPLGRVRHRAPDRRIIVEPLVLAEIEVADDGDHPELVGAGEDRLEAAEIVWAQRTIRAERVVVPGLILGVTLRAASLQIDREAEKSVAAPLGHRVDEFTRVAVRIPAFGVRVDPHLAGRRVQVVEDPLDHA